jgi:hypothetical protein
LAGVRLQGSLVPGQAPHGARQSVQGGLQGLQARLPHRAPPLAPGRQADPRGARCGVGGLFGARAVGSRWAHSPECASAAGGEQGLTRARRG